MADALLVSPEIQAGSLLIEDMRSGGIDVRSAAWVYDESSRWRLHIVASLPMGLDGNPYRSLTKFFGIGVQPGPNAAAISRALKIEDVALHTPSSAYARALKRLSQGGMGVYPRRISDRYVEGFFFPEAVVYKLAA